MRKIVGIMICIFMAISTISIKAEQNDTRNEALIPEQTTGAVPVSIYGNAFHPDVVIIDLNTTVTWTNLEPLPHSVVSDTGEFRSSTLDLGESFSYTFVKKDNYPYHDGNAPSIKGRVVCFPGGKQTPITPVIQGPDSGKKGTTYNYTAVAFDPEGMNVSYFFDWGDKTNSGWTPFVKSGTLVNASHSWKRRGNYVIKVQAKDSYANATSEWASLNVAMPLSSAITFTPFFQQLFERLLTRFPLLRQLFGYY